MNSKNIIYVLIAVIAVLIISLPITSPMALILGLILSIGFNLNLKSPQLTQKLLKLSVIGLGAGMNLNVILMTGMKGIYITFISIIITFGIGYILAKSMKIKNELALLITSGTAICGGSAIAAIAPTIQSSALSTSLSLGIVFILNSIALLVFPTLGHYFNLTEAQFGMWSALSIHDTSSVVGATLSFGALAVETGTTLKLTRALWIIPLTTIISLITKNRSESINKKHPPKIPYFVLGFLILATLVTYFPFLYHVGKQIEWLSRKTLILTLFLIGLNLSRNQLRQIGLKPFLFGTFLWILISSISLFAIFYFPNALSISL